MRSPEIVLVTKSECHLCDAARDVVARVASEAGLGWEERRIDEERWESLRDRFAEEVPVVLIDGVQRDFWTINEPRLRRTVEAAKQR